MNQSVHVTCNISFLIATEGLLNVIGSHVHGKCGNISETVQNREVFMTNH